MEEKNLKKRKGHYPMFDASNVPDDLCPIATELISMRTGDWRSERPLVLRSKCVKCATCWAFCPVQCIHEKASWFEADMNRCKGCSICAYECPHNAIIMVEEKE